MNTAKASLETDHAPLKVSDNYDYVGCVGSNRRVPRIAVNEIFRSLQGEGALSGLDTLFIRTQLCRIGCQWCDTKSSWKKSGKFIKVSDIVKRIRKDITTNTWVCFTGGEPLEYFESISWMSNKLKMFGYKVSIETNGFVRYDRKEKKFIFPDKKEAIDLMRANAFFSISPKLVSALGKRFDFDSTIQMIYFWLDIVDVSYKLQFKFVVGVVEDLELVEKILITCQLNERYVYLQIEDSKIKDKRFINKVNKLCMKYPIRVGIQLHKVIGLS